MFFKRKKKTRFVVTQPIYECIIKLIVYRMKNDPIARAEFIANGGNIEKIHESIDPLSIEFCKKTTECYIVNLVANYCNLKRLAGENYGYKDIVYTIDQNLPKPKGYIPVEKWAPENFAEYIIYRLSIDLDLAYPYPPFVIDDKLDEIIATLDSHLKKHGNLGDVK